MNSLERIQATMAGEAVDRIPVVPIFMAWAAEYAGHSYGAFQQEHRVFTDSILKTWERFKFDQLTTLSDPYRETSDYGTKIAFRENSVGKVESYLLQEHADLNKLRRFPIDEAPRMLDRLRGIETFHRETGGAVSILGWVEGPLAEYCTLRSLETALMDLLTTPEMFAEASEITMGNAIDWAKAQVDAGADMIGVGDAACSLISVDTYREQVLPWQQRLFQGIHDAGAKVRLHICGNINHLLPELKHAGADVVDLDWMVDLPRAREVLGEETTLFGQFDPAAVLRYGAIDDVVAHARKNIAEGGQRFGLMPGCEVPQNTPEENIAAFCPGAGCRIRDLLQR